MRFYTPILTPKQPTNGLPGLDAFGGSNREGRFLLYDVGGFFSELLLQMVKHFLDWRKLTHIQAWEVRKMIDSKGLKSTGKGDILRIHEGYVLLPILGCRRKLGSMVSKWVVNGL